MRFLLLGFVFLVACEKTVKEEEPLLQQPVAILEPHRVKVRIQAEKLFIGDEIVSRDVLIATLMTASSGTQAEVQVVGDLSDQALSQLLEMCAVAGVSRLVDADGEPLSAASIKEIVSGSKADSQLPEWMQEVLGETLQDGIPAQPGLPQTAE